MTLRPSRPRLAKAAQLGGAWPAIANAVRSDLAAAREYLIENGYPRQRILADDVALEMIDRIGDLDQVDRYLLRLALAILCRGTASRSNGHHTENENDHQRKRTTPQLSDCPSDSGPAVRPSLRSLLSSRWP
ncbi:MAG TPA: hypothetical protein VF913_16825 [Xanthobacteraceae bacterium]